MSIFDNLVSFLAHLLTALGLLLVSVMVFVRLTPRDELALIKEGSAGAGVALGGVIIGFALAIGTAVAHSTGLWDALLWASIGLLAQLLGFLGVRLLVPHWREAMAKGEMAPCVLEAAVAVAVGILTASSLTF